MATIHVECSKTQLPNSDLQSLPYSIAYDGPAKVGDYFNSIIKFDKKDSTYKASFRGYPLNGTRLVVPKSYIGIVMHEKVQRITDKEERRIYVRERFDSLTYWNWDKMPSKNDPFVKAMDDWISVAEVLHSPVVEE